MFHVKQFASRGEYMQNYQKMLDAILACGDIQDKTLFLHACCAPCSSYVLEYLAPILRITLFFYNPNISPEREYLHRKDELIRLVQDAGWRERVAMVDADYDPESFDALSRGHETDPERGERCRACIAHRLEQTFRAASDLAPKPDFVGTTLSISPHKDAPFINACGEALSKKYGIAWLYADFKKKGGYLRSIELSRKYTLYRQNFCGCTFSQRSESIL